MSYHTEYHIDPDDTAPVRSFAAFLDYTRSILDANHIALLQWEIDHEGKTTDLVPKPCKVTIRDTSRGKLCIFGTGNSYHGYTFDVDVYTKTVKVFNVPDLRRYLGYEWQDFEMLSWDEFIKTDEFKEKILGRNKA